MRGYQMQSTAQSGGCLISLRPTPLITLIERVVGGDSPAVPVSPGHVRRLHPYPPSHRRRR